MRILKDILVNRSVKNKHLHDNSEKIRIGVFISIPRNASHSIRNILQLGKNRDQENTNSLIIYENHQRASVLNEKYDLKDLFVFSFSRNPYDRCISWYEFHKQKGLEPYKSTSFDSWVRKGLPHHWKIQNDTDYISENISPLLQYNFIENNKVDFIGKLENFVNDMNVVIHKLNAICEEKDLNYRFKYSKIKMNESNRKLSLDQYYNTNTKKIVYTLLEKDFQTFGYDRN